MTSDQLTSMYAEIVRGTPKTKSRFADAAGFSELWDKVAAEVAAIRKANPDAAFDIPAEVAG
jgi:hypothetical protein